MPTNHETTETWHTPTQRIIGALEALCLVGTRIANNDEKSLTHQTSEQKLNTRLVNATQQQHTGPGASENGTKCAARGRVAFYSQGPAATGGRHSCLQLRHAASRVGAHRHLYAHDVRTERGAVPPPMRPSRIRAACFGRVTAAAATHLIRHRVRCQKENIQQHSGPHNRWLANPTDTKTTQSVDWAPHTRAHRQQHSKQAAAPGKWNQQSRSAKNAALRGNSCLDDQTGHLLRAYIGMQVGRRAGT